MDYGMFRFDVCVSKGRQFRNLFSVTYQSSSGAIYIQLVCHLFFISHVAEYSYLLGY